MKSILRSAVISLSMIIVCSVVLIAQERVITGDEVLVKNDLQLLRGKNIGLITNQSGALQDGRHIADVLFKADGVKLVALFAPEHGIRGEASAGAAVPDSVDPVTGVKLYSLYGKTLKPTAEMLSGIDVLVYDIQDVGVRFYTYISTLDLCLEAAAENHVKFVVLDRPDMIRADIIDGPLLDDSLRSFVGIQSVPSVYGMTPGEFATMLNEAHLLKNGVHADLTVIKMENYRRDMWFDQTGLKWIKPSPNLPDLESVEIYPGDVLLEGTNISEGRGTDLPFQDVGAPFIGSKKLVELMNDEKLPGVKVEAADFTPRSLAWAENPKYAGELCHGIKISVTDRNSFKPVEFGVTLIWALHHLYPDDFKIRPSGFDRLMGVRSVRIAIENGRSPGEIESAWHDDLLKFNSLREKFLLYK